MTSPARRAGAPAEARDNAAPPVPALDVFLSCPGVLTTTYRRLTPAATQELLQSVCSAPSLDAGGFLAKAALRRDRIVLGVLPFYNPHDPNSPNHHHYEIRVDGPAGASGPDSTEFSLTLVRPEPAEDVSDLCIEVIVHVAKAYPLAAHRARYLEAFGRLGLFLLEHGVQPNARFGVVTQAMALELGCATPLRRLADVRRLPLG